MKNKTYATPEYMTAQDIKRIRKKMNLTQRELAELLGRSKPTVEISTAHVIYVQTDVMHSD